MYRLLLFPSLFVLPLVAAAQGSNVNPAALTESAKSYLAGASEREWVFEAYDVDMSLANKCYSGGSFIFTKEGEVKFRNCIDNKLNDKEFSWDVEFKEPHHIILTLENDEEYYLNIYEDQERKDVLWMDLTSIDGTTNRFSEFYQLIYTP